MFKQINRPVRDYLSNFQNYLNSNSITDDDKIILSQLEPYIIDANYSPAFNDYNFGINQINQNNNIITCGVKPFWKKHKSHIDNMIEGASDSTECPVCGISYRDNFQMGKSVEHVLPKSKFHQYIFSPINLVYFCKSCNNFKDNHVPNRIFHPLFANINCQEIINISFNRPGNRLLVDVSIPEPDSDYNFLINELYKIPNTYQKYILEVINTDFSSIEPFLKDELKGLTTDEKKLHIRDYITKKYRFNPKKFKKTDTECLLIDKVEDAIKRHPDIFVEYILNRLPTLRDC
ncbi:HNH endonuclease [Granulicatella adiacens]|uniref:HNH endonuclease n=1 Tax=Granulicatella adiacens TaxID=46124 RepID=UPI0021A43422|nr:hypothetical protein [Granulicatella adiacens]MCT2160477.1 hypothetical protein [Granulicatella adiacens]